MRSPTVEVEAARTARAIQAPTARKVQESVAIHAALGLIAIKTRLREIDCEIAAHKAECKPHAALLLATLGLEGPTHRRQFLFLLTGAGLLAWLASQRWPSGLHPSRSRELYKAQEIQQEREALFKLKNELS
jgi:hypothetical protein